MRWLHRATAVGHALLLLLGLAWAAFERPAPVIYIAWQPGLAADARERAERELRLGGRRPLEDNTEYELWSPRRDDIRAIIDHPAVRDTQHLDRQQAAISPDAGRGVRRVWWAGPFRGGSSAAQFRFVFAAIFTATFGCWWLARRRRWQPPGAAK
ncbi:MAG: hypothetical protein AB7P99_09730 [Vicinamibacterales bacterium]